MASCGHSSAGWAAVGEGASAARHAMHSDPFWTISDPICDTWGWTPGSPSRSGSCSGGADDPPQAAFLFRPELSLPPGLHPGLLLGASGSPSLGSWGVPTSGRTVWPPRKPHGGGGEGTLTSSFKAKVKPHPRCSWRLTLGISERGGSNCLGNGGGGGGGSWLPGHLCDPLLCVTLGAATPSLGLSSSVFKTGAGTTCRPFTLCLSNCSGSWVSRGSL